jgi:hypothetical protein
MPVGDVFRIRTKGTHLGSRVEFGVHVEFMSAAADPADLVASWIATIMPLVTAATSVETNWLSVMASDTNPLGAASVEVGLTQPNPGAIAGDALPPQNAVVVSLRTGLKGGRRRGRFFVPGISETGTALGRLSGTQLTAIQALASGIMGAYGSAGTEAANYRLAVYSPIDTTPPPPKPFKPKNDRLVTHITEFTVDPVVRTQRRRAIGVGI